MEDQRECQKNTDECCQVQQSGVSQTLEEMDFERGIWMAAKDGNLKRVQELLDKGVSANQEDSAGYRPLHYAARSGHYHVCKLLLDNGAEVNAVTRSIRATALHRAATQGHNEVVNVLLSHGADANITDVDGATALHRAVRSAKSDDMMCTQLVEKTDLIIRDSTGYTVQELAVLYSKPEVFHLIIKQLIEQNVITEQTAKQLTKQMITQTSKKKISEQS